MDKDVFVVIAAQKTGLNDNGAELLKPSSRSLFETIKRRLIE